MMDTSLCPFRRPSFFSTVTPGQLPTNCADPVSALKSVVLPQLGLPANAIVIGMIDFPSFQKFPQALVLPNSIFKETGGSSPRLPRFCSCSAHLDHLSVSLAQAQLITADVYFNGISQRCNLPHEDLCPLGNAHIHDAPAHSALAMELVYHHGFSDLHFFQGLHLFLLPSVSHY